MFKRKNGLDLEADWRWEGNDKEKGVKDYMQFLGYKMNTYGIVDFEVLIDYLSGKISGIVFFKSESRTEDTGLKVISI